jgi:hypothetical protein
MSVTISSSQRCSVRLYSQLFVVGLMSYLRCCVCLRIVISSTYCFILFLLNFFLGGGGVLFLFFFCFFFLFFMGGSSSCVPYVAVSLDCPFLIAPSVCVFPNVYVYLFQNNRRNKMAL